jgi:hypothetical protein
MAALMRSLRGLLPPRLHIRDVRRGGKQAGQEEDQSSQRKSKERSCGKLRMLQSAKLDCSCVGSQADATGKRQQSSSRQSSSGASRVSCHQAHPGLLQLCFSARRRNHPGVRQHLLAGQALGWVHHQQLADQLFCLIADLWANTISKGQAGLSIDRQGWGGPGRRDSKVGRSGAPPPSRHTLCGARKLLLLGNS